MKTIDKNSIIALSVIIGVLSMAALVVYFVKYTARVTESDTEATRTLVSREETPYTDLAGNPFIFDDYRGMVRVVNTWASWSPFSVDELKNLEQIGQEYSDQNVAVIAINRKEPKERAVQFLSTIADFTAIHFAVDLTDAYYQSVGGFSMPETVFYDSRGNIVFHKRGALTMDEMYTYVDAALGAQKK